MKFKGIGKKKDSRPVPTSGNSRDKQKKSSPHRKQANIVLLDAKTMVDKGKKKTVLLGSVHSPKIKRIITERIKEFYTVRWALSATIICLASCIVVAMLLNLQTQEMLSLKSQKSVLENSLVSWQKIIKKYPDYRDGYLQAAVLAYRLKNDQLSLLYTEKALLFDPTYDPAKRLLAILEGRK